MSFSLKPIGNIADSAANRIIKIIPSVTFSNKKVTGVLKWAGQHLSSPPSNRFILGVSALMSQPFIDLNNRRVDEKTRKVSAARTIAKIVAGTTTGVIIRWLCFKATKSMSMKPSKSTGFLRSLLYPKNTPKVTVKGLTHHKMFLGHLLSLGVMMFTNFAIDAPLTISLTNKLLDKIDKKEKKITNNYFKKYPYYSSIDEFVTKSKEVNNGISK